MPWIDLNRSIRRTLLIVLLPAAIALMGAAWVIHGALLERMARSFVEDRLREEVGFLKHRINQADGSIDALSTGDYFEEVFHHAFAVRVGSQQYVSLGPWKPLLGPCWKRATQDSSAGPSPPARFRTTLPTVKPSNWAGGKRSLSWLKTFPGLIPVSANCISGRQWFPPCCWACLYW